MPKFFLLLLICFTSLVLSCKVNYHTASEKRKKEREQKRLKYKSYYTKHLPDDEKFLDGGPTFVKSTKDTLGSIFILRTYNPDKMQFTEMSVCDFMLYDAMHGSYKELWDNGFPKIEGKYILGQKTGIWKTYSARKKNEILTIEEYHKALLHGHKKEYLNGVLISDIFYKNGLRDGHFTKYNSQGHIIESGTYKEDVLQNINLQSDQARIDKNSKKARFIDCMEVSEDNQNNCALDSLNRFIRSKVTYPKYAHKQRIQGTVLIRANIDTFGKLSKIVALRGICSGLEKEAIKVVNSMPNWVPATRDGVAVESEVIIPIGFSLHGRWKEKNHATHLDFKTRKYVRVPK